MTIAGPGADVLQVVGGDDHQLLYVGGPLVDGAAPVTISGLTLTRGYASTGGGAIHVRSQDLTLHGVVISASGTSGVGGAVDFDDATIPSGPRTLTITGSSLTGNYGQAGGAVAVRGSGDDAVVIEDSVLADNVAYADGGGLLVRNATSTTIGSAFTGNVAGYAGTGEGGGAHFELGAHESATITGSTVDGNRSHGAGGGVALKAAATPAPTLTLTGSTVSGNTTGGGGGGGGVAALGDGEITIARSTITGNIGSLGGGAVAYSATVGIPPSGDEPAKYNSASSAAITISDSIVWGNLDSDDADDDVATIDQRIGYGTLIATPATITANHSLVGAVTNAGITATEGNGNLVGVDPELGPLADNGGSVATHLPAAGSVVKDAAHPTATGTVDQRGLPRVVGGRMDMGSVEIQDGSGATTTTSTTAPTTTSTTAPTFTPAPAPTPSTTVPAPPTTTPAARPPAPPVRRGAGANPVFVGTNGAPVVVPRPPAAPPTVTSSVAVSPTEAIAITADGQVFATNPNHNLGGVPRSLRLRAPMVGMGLHWTRRTTAAAYVATADDEWVPSGYWLLGADGGVFSFGTARFLGSTGSLQLAKPIVAMTPTPSGDGYWLVGADGGVFTFGDAGFFGSTGGLKLAKPVVSLLPTASGRGYWLIAADGGVFTFGDATFHGSAATTGKTFTGAVRSASGSGYVLLASDGTTHLFG